MHDKCDAFDFICRKCTRSRTTWWKLGRMRSLSFTRLVTAVADNAYLLEMEVTILSTRICLCLDHALVFWESSMYVQVHTSLGLKIQVQVSPQIQLYLTPPTKHNGPISGQPVREQKRTQERHQSSDEHSFITRNRGTGRKQCRQEQAGLELGKQAGRKRLESHVEHRGNSGREAA